MGQLEVGEFTGLVKTTCLSLAVERSKLILEWAEKTMHLSSHFVEPQQ